MVTSRYYTNKRLYELLPSIYRQREIETSNFILKSLLGIISEQVGILEDDMQHLYDNWFIETCDEWIIPYIADLLGVEGFHSRSEDFIRQRAIIANTIKYRRSKGTANTLEQIAHDITNWGVKVVEFFRLLNITANVNHLTLNSQTVDLRDMRKLMFVGTPLEAATHTPDIRNISAKQGYYNIQNIGIFLWRLRSFPVRNSPAYNCGNGRFKFSQLGIDLQLFSGTNMESLEEQNDTNGIIENDKITNVSMPLTREMCSYNLNKYYSVYSGINYPDSNKSIMLHVDDTLARNLDVYHVAVSELSDWTPIEKQPPEINLLIDPVSGRMLFLNGLNPQKVNVSYYYGFSDSLGGGFYERKQEGPHDMCNSEDKTGSEDGFTHNCDESSIIDDSEASRPTIHFGISKGKAQTTGDTQNEKSYIILHQQMFENKVISSYINRFSTIQDAMKRWENDGMPNAIFEILDNETYEEELKIELKSESDIRLCSSERQRATIRGSINILGRGGGNITFDGLLIDSIVQRVTKRKNPKGNENKNKSISIDKEGDLCSLNIRHCTLVPKGITSIFVDGGNNRLLVDVDHSICGKIHIANSDARIKISTSIIDGKGQAAIFESFHRDHIKNIKHLLDESHIALDCNIISDISNSTIFGKVDAMMIDNSNNTIFTEPIRVMRRQRGVLKFCYVSPGSNVPRIYRCIEGITIQNVDSDATKMQRREQLIPLFTSEIYGRAGYAQLHDLTPIQISEGAGNGSEMGAFNSLHQRQKIKMISRFVNDYLRFGLELGMFTAN